MNYRKLKRGNKEGKIKKGFELFFFVRNDVCTGALFDANVYQLFGNKLSLVGLTQSCCLACLDHSNSLFTLYFDSFCCHGCAFLFYMVLLSQNISLFLFFSFIFSSFFPSFLKFIHAPHSISLFFFGFFLLLTQFF